MSLYNANLNVHNTKLIYRENMLWYYEYTLLRSRQQTSLWVGFFVMNPSVQWSIETLPTEDITPHTTFRFSSALSGITSKPTTQNNGMNEITHCRNSPSLYTRRPSARSATYKIQICWQSESTRPAAVSKMSRGRILSRNKTITISSIEK
jgi:hypothetical protein